MRVLIHIDELWPHYELVAEKDDPDEKLFAYEGCYDMPRALFEEYQKSWEHIEELRRQIRDILIGSDPL